MGVVADASAAQADPDPFGPRGYPQTGLACLREDRSIDRFRRSRGTRVGGSLLVIIAALGWAFDRLGFANPIARAAAQAGAMILPIIITAAVVAVVVLAAGRTRDAIAHMHRRRAAPGTGAMPPQAVAAFGERSWCPRGFSRWLYGRISARFPDECQRTIETTCPILTNGGAVPTQWGVDRLRASGYSVGLCP